MASVKRLVPGDGAATVALADQFAELDLAAGATADRPYTVTNFAATVDGRATIKGRSGPIGSDADTEVLMLLRSRADAVMIGAGTMRAERYGRMVPDADRRTERERRGLPPDPLAVIVSGTLDLPWDAELFTEGAGEVVIFTGSTREPPATATPTEVVHQAGSVDLAGAMRHLRIERGVGGLLCEGGPHLHTDLVRAGLVDELFLTIAPKLSGGLGPGILADMPEEVNELELVWLLESEGELFSRYRRRG